MRKYSHRLIVPIIFLTSCVSQTAPERLLPVAETKTLEAPAVVSVQEPEPSEASAPAPGADEWKFQIVPYLWFADIEGTQRIGAVEVPIDLGFDDVIDNLEFAFMMAFEAHKDRWGFLVDFEYLDLEASDTLPMGVSLTGSMLALRPLSAPAGRRP